MLEDAQNQLPDELSSRFSLNRFLAFQRDVVNDELQANVPDLVEDALENPTGTYQQVVRFQNTKLVAIDRTTLSIKDALDDILLRVNKMYEASKNGGGDSGGLLAALMAAMGLGGARPRNPGRRPPKAGKNPIPKPGETPKPKKFKEKVGAGLDGFKRDAKYLRNMMGLLIGYQLYTGELTLDGIVKGEENDTLIRDASMGVAAYAEPKMNNFFYQKDLAKSVKAAAAKATQTKPSSLLRRRDLDPTHPQYKAPGEKGASQFVSKKVTEETLAKRMANTRASVFFKKSSTLLGEGSRYMKSGLKSSMVTGVVIELTNFVLGLQALPQDLPDAQLNKQVAELAAKCIANVGIQVFAGFIADFFIIGGALFIGFATGGPIGAILTGGAATIGSLVLNFATYAVTETLIGEDVRKIATRPDVIDKAAYIVGWLRAAWKYSKPMATAASASLELINPGILAGKIVTGQETGLGNFLSATGSAIADGASYVGSAVGSLFGGGPSATPKPGLSDVMTPGIIGPGAVVAAANFIAATTGITSPISKSEAENMNMTPSEAAGLNKIIQKGTKGGSVKKAVSPMLQTPLPDRIIKPKMEGGQKSFEEILDERMTRQAKEVASSKNSPAQPTMTDTGSQRFKSTPLPVSMAIAAMRGNGLADVYPHPLSGPTMERMDRGGETLFS